MEEEQQRRRFTQPFVLRAIERLADLRHREERHKLTVDGWEFDMQRIDRHSLEYLVHFLDQNHDSHEVTEIALQCVRLESDGSLNVLRDLFCKKRYNANKSHAT
jgi:hypothetical protein